MSSSARFCCICLYLLFSLPTVSVFAQEDVKEEVTEQRSRVEVPNPIFDFGTVSQGTKVEHEFVIKNSGNAPLNVQRVVASCGCTATNAEPNVIAPGAEGKVKVVFDTTGFSGQKTKTVRVYTNDLDSSTTTLTLKGLIETDVAISPKSINFNEVVAGEEHTQSANVTIKSGSGVEIEKVKTFSKHIKVTKESLGSDVTKISVTILPDASVGQLRDKVVVGLKGARYNSVNIPVFASVKGVLRLSPQTVSFGVVEGEQSLTRTVKLDNVGQEPISVNEIKSSHPALTASVKEVKAGKRFVVNLSVDPKQVKKDLRASLEIKTSLESQGNVSVNVYGIAPKKS